MKTSVLMFVVTGTVFLSETARAGTNFVLNVEIKEGKPSECVLTRTASSKADDAFKVNFRSLGAAARAPEPLTISFDGTPAIPSKGITAGDTGATVRGTLVNRKLTLSDAKGALEAEGCKPQMLVAAAAEKGSAEKETDGSGGADEKTTPVNLLANELNQQAMAFLTMKTDLGRSADGGVQGHKFRLYHLPDGTPAFPLPAHISEKDEIEIWIALPVGAKATVDVLACDKAPGYRIKGSYKDAAAAAGRPQGLEADRTEKFEFLLQAYPQVLQCAGTLTYKIETSGGPASGSATTSISIDPVYRFEWGVGYGFDFGKPQRLSLGDRTSANGSDSEKFIVASKDYTGALPIVTLGVDVCGTNPLKMNWCDRLLMPTIWVNPTRLTDGFGVGLTFRPIFGVGILVGMSVLKSTEFADGLVAKPGDPWAVAGDLPTKKVFNKDSLGLMLAATLDTEIFAALVP